MFNFKINNMQYNYWLENYYNNYKEGYKELLNAIYVENDGNISLQEIDEDIEEFLSNWGREIDRDSRRWWDELTVVGNFHNKYFQWNSAIANGDEPPSMLGWEFDRSAVYEVEPYTETITVTRYKVIK